MGVNIVWGDEEEQGYNALIRSSIYQKAQLLKINKHLEYGSISSGTTEFVLKEVYSGPIWHRVKDIRQYTRYIFASSNCSSPVDGELP